MNNNKVDYVSIHTVKPDFYEDNGLVQKNIDESLLIKWATDEVSDWNLDTQKTQSIAWLTVRNYKFELPNNTYKILEIAYKQDKSNESCGIKGVQITEWANDTLGCEVTSQVNCKDECDGCGDHALKDVVIDVTRNWEITHPEIYYDKYVKVGRFGYGNSIYSPKWKLLSATTNDFFGMNMHLPGCANLYCRECPESYRINGRTVETSFEKGEVLVSYLGTPVDENGDVMIPNHRDAFEAILQHLTYKWFHRQYVRYRKPSDKQISMEAMQLRDQARIRVMSRLGTPSADEFGAFWYKNKWSKMDSAYSNLMKGYAPITDLRRKNHRAYRS